MKDKYIIKQECECQYIKWFDITNDDSPTDKIRYKIWRDR